MVESTRELYPTWVRVTLVLLLLAGVIGGIVLGRATYDSWSTPDAADPPPTVVEPEAPEEPEPEVTLG